MKHLTLLMKDESGATAIEYALIASLISIAIIGAATTLGSTISTQFGVIASAISGAGTR